MDGFGSQPATAVSWLSDEIVAIDLIGEHDLLSAPQLREELLASLDQAECVIVDVASAELIDSSILRVLVQAKNRADADGKHFALVAAEQTTVFRVLEITRLVRPLNVVKSRAAAIELVSSLPQPDRMRRLDRIGDASPGREAPANEAELPSLATA